MLWLLILCFRSQCVCCIITIYDRHVKPIDLFLWSDHCYTDPPYHTMLKCLLIKVNISICFIDPTVHNGKIKHHMSFSIITMGSGYIYTGNICTFDGYLFLIATPKPCDEKPIILDVHNWGFCVNNKPTFFGIGTPIIEIKHQQDRVIF